MGHQGPSVGLALDVDVRAKLQPPGAGVGALRLELGGGRVRTGEDAFGQERKGGVLEVRSSIDGLRRNRQRRLERRRGGVVEVRGSGKRRGRRRGEEEEAGAHGLAGSMVHLHLLVLLPFFVFFLLFLLRLLDLKLLRADL